MKEMYLIQVRKCKGNMVEPATCFDLDFALPPDVMISLEKDILFNPSMSEHIMLGIRNELLRDKTD